MEADLGPDAPENVIKDLIATVANDLKDDFSLENSASISATGVSLDGCKRKKIVRDAFSSATPRLVYPKVFPLSILKVEVFSFHSESQKVELLLLFNISELSLLAPFSDVSEKFRS